MKNTTKQFNRHAPTYEAHATIQRKMALSLMGVLLSVHKNNTSTTPWILDAGCGTGTLTSLLAQRLPNASLFALDAAENMLDIAKERLQEHAISWIHQDIEALPSSTHPSYDFILSNALIQWLKRPEETLAHLIRYYLKPDGYFLATTFGPDTFMELNQLFRTVEQEMGLPTYPHHLPLKKVVDWHDLLQQSGLVDVELQESHDVLLYDNCHQFLHSIKSIGASYSQSCHSLGTTRKLLTQVMKRYDETYRREDQVYTTYHMITMLGRKK